MHRFADVAVEGGHLLDALDAYTMLQEHAADPSSRALAALKHLDLAVAAGYGLRSEEVFRWVTEHTSDTRPHQPI